MTCFTYSNNYLHSWLLNNYLLSFLKPCMQTASKKVINAWAMYDWANSAYNLVITSTFFPLIICHTSTKDAAGKIIAIK